LPTMRLTKTAIERALPRERLYTLNDDRIPGFMIKITENGTKTFVYQYRARGGRSDRTRTLTLGRFGPLTVDQARDLAAAAQAAVLAGQDPAAAKRTSRREMTVSELCDDYLAHGTGTKKASTLSSDRGRIERHIKPLLGACRLSEVTPAMIQRFLKDVALGRTATDVPTKKYGRARVTGGEGTATRTVGLLGGIFSYAVRSRLLEKSPVLGVERYKDKTRER